MGPGWDPGEAVHSDLPCWQCLWEAILYDAGMLPWRSLWEAASRVSLVKPFPWEYWLAAFSGTATQEDAWRSHSQLESCWWLFTKKLLKRQLEKLPLGIAPGWCCLWVVLPLGGAARATCCRSHNAAGVCPWKHIWTRKRNPLLQCAISTSHWQSWAPCRLQRRNICRVLQMEFKFQVEPLQIHKSKP